jgi:hypothetical protein
LQQSLDLAFVITGEAPPVDTGACCYPEPTGSGDWLCVETDEDDCVTNLGGVWEGAGTVCQGMEACCLPVTGECVDADALCCVNELGGTPQGPGTSCQPTEACCFGDGSCMDLDPLCCQQLGGTPQGPGTQCQPVEGCCMADGSCRDLDPNCCVFLGGTPQGPGTQCTKPMACCVGDNCIMADPLCCDDQGGVPSPIGAAVCWGDWDGNGVDDACEEREDTKWIQWPDLDPTGMDITAVPPFILADDFLCTQTGPITEIHVWGSWYHDVLPGDPSNVSFTLSLHADIPVGPFGWSVPGEPLWIREFQPGAFVVQLAAGGLEEGWFEPPDFYDPMGDTQCWEYIFFLDEGEFIQLGSESDPIVYWLNVQATPLGDGAFGWKTSLDHWNDDGVWTMAPEPVPPDLWYELRYVPPHPMAPESIDLAFAIFGPTVCDAIIGDANGSGGANPIDIDDAVYLIAYIFSEGPAPTPYEVASGDASCDCTVDIDDVVYLIAYIFSEGPPPCTCEEWVAACGPLH